MGQVGREQKLLTQSGLILASIRAASALCVEMMLYFEERALF